MEGRRTGVEEYTLGLLLSLLEIDKKNEYTLFFSAWKEPSFDFAIFSNYPNVKLKKIRIPNKLLNFSFWYLGWPKIDRLVGGADVVFFPNIIFGAVSEDIQTILTIHDLSFERYPEYFSWKRRFWHIFINSKKICQRANEIITVSDSSATDISSLYEIDCKKITTIPSAITNNFRVFSRNDEKLIKIKEKYQLPYKFILHLGTIEHTGDARPGRGGPARDRSQQIQPQLHQAGRQHRLLGQWGRPGDGYDGHYPALRRQSGQLPRCRRRCQPGASRGCVQDYPAGSQCEGHPGQYLRRHHGLQRHRQWDRRCGKGNRAETPAGGPARRQQRRGRQKNAHRIRPDDHQRRLDGRCRAEGG